MRMKVNIKTKQWVHLVSWRRRRRWRLQFLRLSVFGFRIGRWIRVLGLLLLHPHVGVQASLGEQLFVPGVEETVGHTIGSIRGECSRGGDTHRPRSAICPLLTTRILSAPMMVDSLGYISTISEGAKNKLHPNNRRSEGEAMSYLWATTTVVRLAHTLASEAWMLRSVWVSRAEVACEETDSNSVSAVESGEIRGRGGMMEAAPHPAGRSAVLWGWSWRWQPSASPPRSASDPSPPLVCCNL